MRKIVTLLLCLWLAAAPAGAVSVLVDGVPLESDIDPVVINSTTYVPLRAVTEALREDAVVTWEGQAVVRAGSDLELTAAPGAIYLEANGRALYIADGVQAAYGRVLVPVRVLAKAMDAQVDWDGGSRTVSLTSGAGAIESASVYYKEDELYWLSRIISAESRGEPLLGKSRWATWCSTGWHTASSPPPSTALSLTSAGAGSLSRSATAPSTRRPRRRAFWPHAWCWTAPTRQGTACISWRLPSPATTGSWRTGLLCCASARTGSTAEEKQDKRRLMCQAARRNFRRAACFCVKGRKIFSIFNLKFQEVIYS